MEAKEVETYALEGGLPWSYKDPSIEVAVTGKLMRHLYTRRDTDGWLYRAVISKANVFARMAPDDKAMLVSSLQNALLGQAIGMCGDGANDCAALKQADAGISLSQAEASIAAPFTCSVPNIECVPTLLREGKASLATSFQIAKFIISYALLQWFQCIQLYFYGQTLADFTFLYEDMVSLIPLSIFQSYTAAYPILTKEIPTESLFHFPQIFSVVIQLLIMWAVQLGLLLTLKDQPFYRPPWPAGPEEDAKQISY